MNMIEWDLTLGGLYLELDLGGFLWGRYVSYQYRRVGENGEYQYNPSQSWVPTDSSIQFLEIQYSLIDA